MLNYLAKNKVFVFGFCFFFFNDWFNTYTSIIQNNVSIAISGVAIKLIEKKVKSLH